MQELIKTLTIQLRYTEKEERNTEKEEGNTD